MVLVQAGRERRWIDGEASGAAIDVHLADGEARGAGAAAALLENGAVVLHLAWRRGLRGRAGGGDCEQDGGDP